MKASVTFRIIVAGILLAGCKRETPGTSQNGTNQTIAVEPGTRAAESPNWGYLPLTIRQAHEKQKLLEQFPWHGSGGDWTFLECEVDKQASARAIIGVRTRSTTREDIPISWGEALIAVEDTKAGAAFVDVFSKAFHQSPPQRYGEKPPGSLKVHTAVLGERQIRSPKGGFRNDPKGTWTATKWFLQNEDAEAEVYFNYSIAERRAEFSEKDEDYRETLIEQLVIGLRDGPLPERTPENDPTLTLNGPQMVDWKRIAGTNEAAQFASRHESILITATEEGKGSQLFLAPIDRPMERKRLADFVGSVLVHEAMPTTQGVTLLVSETIRKDPKSFSTTDPQQFWILDEQGKHKVMLPADATNWFVGKASISPDGQFLALHAWKKRDKHQNRVIHLGDPKKPAWQTVEIGDTNLELVGWTGENPTGIVLAGNSLKRAEKRNAYSLDPRSGKMSPLESIPAEFDPDVMTSPNHRRSVALQEKQGLIITELPSGARHEFTFHPYDKRVAYPDSVRWATDRYLVFQGSRTALIDADTLKMNFPVAKESGFSSVEFSRDFRWGIATKNGEQYLGRVKLPDMQRER